MNKSFLNCESSAESAFRLFVCNAALVVAIICIIQGIYLSVTKSTFTEGLLKDTFGVERVSKLSAYYYEDFFKEYKSYDRYSVPQSSEEKANISQNICSLRS